MFVGLLMEMADDKEWFKNIRKFRRSKHIKLWGEWFVAAGVFIEVILAGFTAFSEWKNDPLKKPVAYASARVSIVIKTLSNRTSPFLPKDPQIGWNAAISFFNQKLSNGVFALTANTCALWRMGTTNEQECRMDFREDPLNFLEDESRRTKTLVKQFNDVDAFIMQLPEMETNAEIVSGTVLLNVNEFTWTFDVPRQVSKWGAITMHKIKDKNGQTMAQAWRIPIGDFVYPPRFTNLWYDGK